MTRPAPDPTRGTGTSTGTETLPPSASVALGVILVGGAALAAAGLAGAPPPLLAAAGLPLLLGVFLLLQTWLLRLDFSADALRVLSRQREIRRFPYADWQAWRLFWPGLPVLFYFRETRSIHLLPVLFDPTALRRQLHHHLPHLAPETTP
ncbi:MAG: DUF3119 family protein [Prochlorococcaceae cyanobacterium]